MVGCYHWNLPPGGLALPGKEEESTNLNRHLQGETRQRLRRKKTYSSDKGRTDYSTGPGAGKNDWQRAAARRIRNAFKANGCGS